MNIRVSSDNFGNIRVIGFDALELGHVQRLGKRRWGFVPRHGYVIDARGIYKRLRDLKNAVRDAYLKAESDK